MALPTESDITGMDISYKGEPFVQIKASSSIDTTGMDWSYLGEPFVTEYGGGGVITYIKVIRASWDTIGKVLGTADSGVKKILGVEP